MTPQTEIKQAHEDFAHTGSSNLYDYMLFYLKVGPWSAGKPKFKLQ